MYDIHCAYGLYVTFAFICAYGIWWFQFVCGFWLLSSSQIQNKSTTLQTCKCAIIIANTTRRGPKQNNGKKTNRKIVPSIIATAIGTLLDNCIVVDIETIDLKKCFLAFLQQTRVFLSTYIHILFWFIR